MQVSDASEAQTGAVTLIQRFGSAANLNVHLHCLVLDGVYDTTGEAPVFHPVRVPTAEQLQTLLHQIIKRVMKLLSRLGYLVEEQDMLFLAETDTDAPWRLCNRPLAPTASPSDPGQSKKY